ncbi:YgaP family membrane protein [Bauldia litoralis]|uniref:YgaP family membrane protein n=1 Tax=Bauldia litoralis TaxID=665467 RepID=UPI0032634487
MFHRNVGSVDRVIRIILGVALLAFFFMVPETPWHWVGLIGIVPLLTAVVGSCPLYSILGLTTCPVHATGSR